MATLPVCCCRLVLICVAAKRAGAINKNTAVYFYRLHLLKSITAASIGKCLE